MNILFLDAYFRPETIAYTHLENDLIEGLVEKGNNITIICPTPTRGISKEIREKYKYIRKEALYGGSVRVIRFWAPQEGKNPLIRAFRYLWCNLRTYQKARKENSIDLIFSNSTPPTQGLLGVWTAKYLSKKNNREIPFIYNLQDIFPDSLVNAKLTSEDSLIWRVGRFIEDYTYLHAKRIITISEGFKCNIQKKGVPENKIEVISNWIDLKSVYPIKREMNLLFSEFGIDTTKFIVVYAGNFGATQGAEIVLQAAKELEPYDNIHFVIFGGGAYFNVAKKEAINLKNVSIHNLMPTDRISEVYSMGDISLITCKSGTGRAGLPSKMWSIMACNTPIIASFDMESDLARILQESKAGICVKPGEKSVLIKAIKDMYYNPIKDRIDSRTYVNNFASKGVCVKKYLKIFERVFAECDCDSVK